MLMRIGYAIVVGIIVGLVCLFLGVILATLDVPPVTAIAKFLTQWAWPIGVLAGLLWFFGNGRFSWPSGPA